MGKRENSNCVSCESQGILFLMVTGNNPQPIVKLGTVLTVMSHELGLEKIIMIIENVDWRLLYHAASDF